MPVSLILYNLFDFSIKDFYLLWCYMHMCNVEQLYFSIGFERGCAGARSSCQLLP